MKRNELNICEWAGQVSHKDLTLVHQFIERQRISELASQEECVAVRKLYRALSLQLALEQGVES